MQNPVPKATLQAFPKRVESRYDSPKALQIQINCFYSGEDLIAVLEKIAKKNNELVQLRVIFSVKRKKSIIFRHEQKKNLGHMKWGRVIELPRGHVL